jgi:hypothetical protein
LIPLILPSGKLQALMLKLGNENEAVWKPAFEDLEYFDPRLAMDLQSLMDRFTETRARQRMVEIMTGRPAGSLQTRELNVRSVRDGFNFTAKTDRGTGSFWAEHRVDRIGSSWDYPKKKWARAVRAIVLLEHIATPAARDIVKDMASGHPDAYPTKVAKEALRILK